MQFRTEIDIKKSGISLPHSEEVVLLGSCFADNMGEKLKSSKFHVLCNPFGVLYNPMSIAWQIERSLNQQHFTAESEELFQDTEVYHSWMHHTSFSASSATEITEKINVALDETYNALKTAKTLIITFGTAIIYQLKHDGRLVANCHKQNDNMFTRRMLSVDEITKRWTGVCLKLHSLNPGLQVIFTVSPVRHKRDGFHANQLSKATLLLAVEHTLESLGDTLKADYFPSYEIMMDELRDYRFYADVMIHPSSTAVEYIWERFADTYISDEDMKIIKSCIDIKNGLSHRANNPASESYLQFLTTINHNIIELKNKCPYLDMESELELCNTLLMKSQA